MKEFLTNNTAEKWEEIKTHPFYAAYREELLRHGEEYLASPPNAFAYTAYCRYFEDGNRSEYERIFFALRARMTELTALTRLYGEKYLGALCDTLWAILDEETWSTPAHIKNGFDDAHTRHTYLDLTSTRTGAELAACEAILGDILPERIRERMRTQIRERIIEPYFHTLCWWMMGTNNWGAVCCANIMFCIAQYGTPEEFYRAEPSMNNTVLNFVASYGADGCCTEGIAYWYYGFGHFVRYADLVRNYTKKHPSIRVAHVTFFTQPRPCDTLPGRDFVKDGVIDYFARKDVQRAALFAANARLNGNCSISFSDGKADFFFSPGTLGYLHKEYPDAVLLPDVSLAAFDISEVRNFLWSDPTDVYGAPMKNGTVYYDATQWFIKNERKYSLAAKGGHNYEQHNHNDVASFLLTTKKGMSFVDLGSGEYTREYFEPKYRYELLVCSSRGHSVPIINGKYQQRPEDTFAHADSNGKDFFSVEYSAFYEDPTLQKAKRSFSCDENGVTVTDDFSFAVTPKSLTERFVSRKEPVLGKGAVTVGDVVLSYDDTALELHVSTEDYSDHDCMMQTVYLIDFSPRSLVKDAEYVFRFNILAEEEKL